MRPPIMPCSFNLHRLFTWTLTCFETFIAVNNNTGTISLLVSKNSSLKSVAQHTRLYQDRRYNTAVSQQATEKANVKYHSTVLRDCLKFETLFKLNQSFCFYNHRIGYFSTCVHVPYITCVGKKNSSSSRFEVLQGEYY